MADHVITIRGWPLPTKNYDKQMPERDSNFDMARNLNCSASSLLIETVTLPLTDAEEETRIKLKYVQPQVRRSKILRGQVNPI
jgi:hypothetical protein